MNRWCVVAILLAFAGALAFRLLKLDTRPYHNDEAVNATKVIDLWQHGRYEYDPDEYHGPTLHYATLPLLWLSSARTPDDLDDRTLRFVPAAFGAALILLLFLFADGIPPRALVWSALFTAISPAMVFYSRYFIHEVLLVFFTALLLGASWRYTRRPSPGWAILAGATLGLMFATKETFVITLAAVAVAAAATGYRVTPKPRSMRQLLTIGWGSSDQPASWLHIGLALSATFLMWLVFFSSFFTNVPGLLDSIRTYFPWLKRATGHSPHLHPWYFYFQRLAWFHSAKGPIWSEGLILVLAAVGAIVSLRQKSTLLRFLTFYTLLLTAAYCAISYKTPWCLLSFFYGMILLAGIGAASLIECVRSASLKAGVMAILLLLSFQLALQSWRASFVYSTDRRNPYVYAQTVPDLLNLVRRVEGIAQVSPEEFNTVVKVIAPADDYWPLPWYLRRFKNIGWYGQIPADPFAPIVIASSQLDARLDEKSGRKWIMAGVSELRPGKFFELYVELQLWTNYVESLPSQPD
ncbi:MAG TPA: flippase activity-associated protein Agl23 [Verrucomicrobiae bacterium]|jgi:uncharacterized protein (TIGR03663 family)|nr:flippase activity-associated protein Agl23 [Verrucomicrobiae bacterium]